MKASYIAVLVSSLALATLPVQADTTPEKIIPIVKTHAAHQKIDINKADLSQLVGSFKGIGKKKAEAIIAYRDSHHGFKSVEEFAEIKGFGIHFVEKNREKLNKVFVVG